MQHVTRFFESMTEGATVAGASLGQAALIGGTASLTLGLAGAFTAAATGHNVFEVAQKCATAGFLAAGGLMATWNTLQLIKEAISQLKSPSLGYRGYCGMSYKAVALGEVATFGVIGYVCAPAVELMVRTLVK